jgi:hypothetical protein
MLLVTLSQAKAHLRVDHDVEDADITLKAEGASAAVMSYLKTTALDYFDSSGEIDLASVPAQVKLATLALVQIMFDRDVSGDTWKPGYLPPAVMNMLYPLRDPALA